MSTADADEAAVVIDVGIESIAVGRRSRRVLGELGPLQASIQARGLVHPVVVSPIGWLISGRRRLAVVRRLGWPSVPVHVAHTLQEAVTLLRAETCSDGRLIMRPSEQAEMGEALAGLPFMPLPVKRDRRLRSVNLVAEALGMSSTSYARLRYIYRAGLDEDLPGYLRAEAAEEMARVDTTGNLTRSYERLRSKLLARQGADEAKAAALADPVEPVEIEPDLLWVPGQGDAREIAKAQRRYLIRYYGARGYTSQQIGKQINMRAETVRRIARESGFEIQAEVALGARTRRGIDSTRVVRETVSTLDALTGGVRLVNYEELDETLIEGWILSLNESITVLNRLRKSLKERIQ